MPRICHFSDSLWHFCCGNCFPGGRYVVLEDGLQILNATDSDSGNYTCRAEVDEFGNYAERFISVAVNSAYFILDDSVHNPSEYWNLCN